MGISVTKGIYFFRLQIEVPEDGEPTKMAIQLCAREVFYETNPDGTVNYKKVIGQSPDIVILTFPSLTELETEFPGVSALIGQLQEMAITKGTQMMELRLNPSAPEPVPAPGLIT